MVREKMTRRGFVAGGLAAGVGVAGGVLSSSALAAGLQDAGRTVGSFVTPGPTTGRGSLKAHAARCGVLVGAAVDVRLLKSDVVYQRVLAEQFNIVVAENAMKWGPLRPAADKFYFEAADELMAFAAKHGMKVRGHNLCWHNQNPAWFAETVTKENARKFLTDHIMTVAGRYKGRMQSWDVVNEAVLPKDGRPDGLRRSPWMELMGPDYIEIAFRAARKADPHALLTYNDYDVEYDNAEQEERREIILRLLRRLKGSGVPLDGVGIQSHIKAAAPSVIGKGLRDFMASVRGMGLQIYITEMDVNEDDLAFDDVARRDHAIAEVYGSYLDIVLAERAVKAVLTWGVSDSHTWLNGGPTHRRKRPNRPQRALPFDDLYQPTEAFFAMRDGFDRRRVGRG
jgi:endo-1,4-beta-xylanase